jgi:1,4-alpha-glucan branching enzyme
MSFTKKYLKSKPLCKVTFELAQEAANGAQEVALAGEFNNWETATNLLKKGKDGVFKGTLDLEAGKEYQFRYVLDGKEWANDPEADKYAPNGFGVENSVIVL